METWLKRLLLTVALSALSLMANAADTQTRSVLDKIITPNLERRDPVSPNIDTEDFELGFYAGIINVEDFGSNAVTGLRLAYHISEDFFAEANYAQSTLQETSFERLSGSTQLLSDEQRELNYYNLSLGYNLLPGEIFIGKDWSFNSAIYLLAGVGNTNFAGDDYFTYNAGIGLRLLATDWLALHFDVRSHIYEHELLGEAQTVFNLESHAGVTFFF